MGIRRDDRDNRENYFGDAVYDAWRRGYDTDRVSRDRCDDHYYRGDPPESVTDDLARADRQRREAREYDEYLEQQQRDYVDDWPGNAKAIEP